LGHCGTVALGCAIALKFAPNGTFVALELFGYLPITLTAVIEGLNLVSFVLGQLWIGHGTSGRLAGQKEAILLAFDPPVLKVLHFVLESKT
jgi:hypothetical protein